MFGFVARTKSVKQRTQSLVRLNLELAQLEAKKKAMASASPGPCALAGVLVVYAIGFFASAAAGISEALPMAVATHRCGLLLPFRSDRWTPGSSLRPQGFPPKPEQAIEEAERTVETLRSHV